MKVIKKYPPLYKRDSKGKIRIWKMEIGTDGVKHGIRSISGLIDGEQVTSAWKTVKGKNIGRANATTDYEQGEFEISASYTKRKDRGMFESLDHIDSFTKFKPMLAGSYSDGIVFDREIFAQPKLDGIRCLARKDGLWSRGFKEIVSCPHIEKQLAPIFEMYPELVLDGELYNHEFKDDFNKIVSIIRKTKPTEKDHREAAEKAQFHIYDCSIDEKFLGRHIFIKDMFSHHSENIPSCRLVETELVYNQERLDELYGVWLEQGYEGQMVRFNEKYENKRSKNLLKRKEFTTDEFPVLFVEEGQGNWAGYVKRMVVDFNGIQNGCGIRGTQSEMKKLLETKKPDWATVRYFGVTPDGKMRFPVVVDWGYEKRED